MIIIKSNNEKVMEKTLFHATLMTIPHRLKYVRAPTNCLDPPPTRPDKTS